MGGVWIQRGERTTVTDASGNGHNLATSFGATWTTEGRNGNALSFNGLSSYVDLGNPALLQITGSMTMSAWVKAAADPADDGQIVAEADDVSGWQLKTSPDRAADFWREAGWSYQYFCPTLQHHGPVVECVVSRCRSLRCVRTDAGCLC